MRHRYFESVVVFRVEFVPPCCGVRLLRHSSMSGEELVRACAEGNDGAAWEEFVSRFHRPISLSIIRTAYQWGEIPQQVVDDLVQDIYLKLCANKCRQLLELDVSLVRSRWLSERTTTLCSRRFG